MEIMQFKFVYQTYSESLSREKFFCGRTKYEKDAFRLESRDDSLETLLMYMGGWHRVSNKNQPHISSIKFLKSRGFFIVVRLLHLSKALWNCLPCRHHYRKGVLKEFVL